jgi:hypothetical protein
MKGRLILAVAAGAALLLPGSISAQQAGAVELGVFGRYTVFDEDVAIENAPGIGGRLGVFIIPNLAIEVEGSYAEPELTDTPGVFGATFVSHELYQARLVYTHWLSESLGLMFGAGYAYDNYTRIRNVGARGGGPAGLLGLRYQINERFSARFAGTGYYVSEDLEAFANPRPETINLGVQAGLSFMFRDRTVETIVQLPAPPPDTVIVTQQVQPPLPQGTATQICLATGENVTVYITPQGDTLVGPQRVAVSALGPGVAFAGEYAAGRGWFENDEPIPFQDREYVQSGGEVSMNCANIMQVGEYDGVPLFANTGATAPYETLYVPVRPGVWQAYQTDLAAVRAD